MEGFEENEAFLVIKELFWGF